MPKHSNLGAIPEKFHLSILVLSILRSLFAFEPLESNKQRRKESKYIH